MLDGYEADARALSDVALLYKTLNALPRKLGMQKVGFPHIIQFTKRPIAGLSGFIFIVESHISIHTYARQRFLSVDIYSCKPFPSLTVIAFLRKVYTIGQIEKQLVKRGTYFNKTRRASSKS